MARAKKEEFFNENIIILRSVYGKVKDTTYIQPCRDKMGRFPDCVKPVDSNGDMILSSEDKKSSNFRFFIKEIDVIPVKDGTVFDLTKPEDRFRWEAIKNSRVIAKERFEKNEQGDYVIDGTKDIRTPNARYGAADLYIDRPGLAAAHKVSRKREILKAQSFIFDDERGAEGRAIKAKMLGKRVENQPDSEITEYLITFAEREPQKVIDLYTGGDMHLRLLLMEAKAKKIIVRKQKVFMYEDTILGATDDAALSWMKNPSNVKILELIKADTYPDLVKNLDKE